METVINNGEHEVNKFLDYMSYLSKTDPDRFEQVRKEEIEKLILEATPERQQGLRDFQRSLDVKAKESAFSRVKYSWQSLRKELKNLSVMRSRLG